MHEGARPRCASVPPRRAPARRRCARPEARWRARSAARRAGRARRSSTFTARLRAARGPPGPVLARRDRRARSARPARGRRPAPSVAAPSSSPRAPRASHRPSTLVAGLDEHGRDLRRHRRLERGVPMNPRPRPGARLAGTATTSPARWTHTVSSASVTAWATSDRRRRGDVPGAICPALDRPLSHASPRAIPTVCRRGRRVEVVPDRACRWSAGN